MFRRQLWHFEAGLNWFRHAEIPTRSSLCYGPDDEVSQGADKDSGLDRVREVPQLFRKAEVGCENSGQVVDDHFAHISEMITIGKGGKRQVEDVRLSCYACYLVQNADPTKEIVAVGPTYFAVQTRRQEKTDELANLTEEQRRLQCTGSYSATIASSPKPPTRRALLSPQTLPFLQTTARRVFMED